MKPFEQFISFLARIASRFDSLVSNNRFIIHFLSSGALMLAFSLTYHFAKVRWENLDRYETTVIPALLIVWLTAMREAYDVSTGGSLRKSISDFFSWTLGVITWGVTIELWKVL